MNTVRTAPALVLGIIGGLLLCGCEVDNTQPTPVVVPGHTTVVHDKTTVPVPGPTTIIHEHDNPPPANNTTVVTPPGSNSTTTTTTQTSGG